MKTRRKASWRTLRTVHDLGKASPAFQRRHLKLADRLRRLGVPLPNLATPNPAPHGRITAKALPQLLTRHLGANDRVAFRLSDAVGGHHGLFSSSADVAALNSLDGGGDEWQRLRAWHTEMLTEVFRPASLCQLEGISVSAAFQLAAITSVSDWIGSNETFFPYRFQSIESSVPITGEVLSQYANQAEGCAARALQDLGWMMQPTSWPTVNFSNEFPHLTPNALQQCAIEHANSMEAPSLLLVEAPTGCGKTEAALAAASITGARYGTVGFYIALPTQASSNQMIERLNAFLKNVYRGENVVAALVHGLASIAVQIEEKHEDADYSVSEICDDEDNSNATVGTVRAKEWFTYRKRGLLAAFGAGTIDQALLGVIKTRHCFVRLFGLSSKVVIIDEVHAYDTYVTTLLERLLEWLAELGTSVVLLSATLPKAKAKRLLHAYAKALMASETSATSGDASLAPYPRLSWVSKQGEGSLQISPTEFVSRSVAIEWVGSLDPGATNFDLAKRLKVELADGGCVAVICNTVPLAQQMYRHLKNVFNSDPSCPKPTFELLHASLLVASRLEREKRILRQFGKDDSPLRKGCHIVIATQILEQSLDVDFDLLISEFAPTDLLLQRIGRLHRHERHRPERLAKPIVWLTRVELNEGKVCFDPGTSVVYDPYILLRSWIVLGQRSVLKIPDETEALIEETYEERLPTGLSPALSQQLKDLKTRFDKLDESAGEEARKRWVGSPLIDDELFEIASAYDEDEESPHWEVQSLTRLGAFSIRLVCLNEEVRIDAPLRTLLRRSVTVTRFHVVKELRDPKYHPKQWEKSAILRRCAALEFDENECAQAGKYKLRLDAELGLLIE
jgi:CRISPR-associated endonuclease/helicase Cas3